MLNMNQVVKETEMMESYGDVEVTIYAEDIDIMILDGYENEEGDFVERWIANKTLLEDFKAWLKENAEDYEEGSMETYYFDTFNVNITRFSKEF